MIVFAGGRYGRARGAKYDRVQTEEEGRSLVDDDLGDFDVEGDVAPVQRDRRGNPVANSKSACVLPREWSLSNLSD